MQETLSQNITGEEGFRLLFKAASVGIIVIDDEGIIQLANPGVLSLFGYHETELIGKPLETLIPPALRKGHVSHRRQYFEQPKIRPMGAGMDLNAMRSDGSVFPVEISLASYTHNGSRFAVAFISDISRRQAAQDDLKRMNELLESRVRERTAELNAALEKEKQLNDLKSRFVAIASHEFRTPLSTVRSSVSLLERYAETGDREKIDRHLSRIKTSVASLLDILNDFLSLDKLEQGDLKLNVASFDCRQLIDETIDSVTDMLKTGQKIVAETSGDLYIENDRLLLRAIIVNLLSNAIKYSPENSEIMLSAAILDKRISCSVHDAGFGIPPADQPHIFEKFFRAGNAIGIQGTGLGLSIIRRYAELMGGRLTFISELGHGSTFTVELPCKA